MDPFAQGALAALSVGLLVCLTVYSLAKRNTRKDAAGENRMIYAAVLLAGVVIGAVAVMGLIYWAAKDNPPVRN